MITINWTDRGFGSDAPAVPAHRAAAPDPVSAKSGQGEDVADAWVATGRTEPE